MAVDEVVNWEIVATDNPSPLPHGPDGKRPRRVGLSMQEMMAAIARYRDTLSGVTGTILLSGTDPRLSWNVTDAAANNKYWDILPVAEQLRMRVVNDAQGVFTNWLTVDRTGTVIDLISLNAPVTISGATRIMANIGFYDTAPIAKPTVTGSRAGNAALADLLTELANLGLITDSSS